MLDKLVYVYFGEISRPLNKKDDWVKDILHLGGF